MPPPAIAPVSPADVALTLAQSVGRRSDAEFYLRLFKQLPAHRFAILAVDARCLAAAEGVLIEHLRFLSHLGLCAPLVLGLFEPSAATSVELGRHLEAAGLRHRAYSSTRRDLAATLRADVAKGCWPVVQFTEQHAPSERYRQLGRWLGELGARKLVVVRAGGGLGPRCTRPVVLGPTHNIPATELGLSLLNLRRDGKPLAQAQLLSAEETEVLGAIEATLEHAAAAEDSAAAGWEGIVASVAAPANLLHELFTVRGAGTLIRQGSIVEHHRGYEGLNIERLTQLLEKSFARRLSRQFFDNTQVQVYLEPHYRGAAIVETAPLGDYLTKFAVEQAAQGHGLGRDLWDALVTTHPRLYWRSRADNAVRAWYDGQCDGRLKQGDWIVYLRGIELEAIGPIVRDALARPEDFARREL